MDMKGIPWFSNLCQKFEAMCFEIEQTMYQDTIKYMENQMETVSCGVKKFCSGVMQDVSPLVYSGHNPLIDVGVCRKPGRGINESPPLSPSGDDRSTHDNGVVRWGYSPLIDVGFAYQFLPFVEEFAADKRHEPISDIWRREEIRHIGVLKSDGMLPISEPFPSDIKNGNSEVAQLPKEEKCTYKRSNPGISSCGNEQVSDCCTGVEHSSSPHSEGEVDVPVEDVSSEKKSVGRYGCEAVDVSGVDGDIEPFDEGGCVIVLPGCCEGEQGVKPVSYKKKIWGALTAATVRRKRSLCSGGSPAAGVRRLESKEMWTTTSGSFESEWEVV